MKRPAIKAPKFLNDLYRDLRDRRLLPLVVVLLVAIPVLPIVLGESAEVAPPLTPPADEALAEGEIPTMPAVLASDPGLRDYHERLEALSSKNPFAQKFGLPDSKAAGKAAIGKVDGAGGSVAVTGSSTASSEAVPSTSATGTTPDATVSTTGTTTTSSGTGSGSGGGSIPDSGVQFYTFRIDVVTGPAGDTERRRNVKRLTVLPSQSNPVAMFMGVAEEGKRAAFLVSSDVIRSHGDGRCSPSPSDCQALQLKVGEERKFEYAPSGEPDTYVIELKDILIVPVDDPRKSKSDDRGRASESAQSGLESFLGF